jgi:hypothetical protein
MPRMWAIPHDNGDNATAISSLPLRAAQILLDD